MDNRELIDLDSAKERFMANEELYKRFLFEFPERTLYADLKQCLEEGNVNGAFEVAHRMKGVVENLSLNVFGKLTREVVEILREGTLPEQTVMDELDLAYEQSIQKIQELKEKNFPIFST